MSYIYLVDYFGDVALLIDIFLKLTVMAYYEQYDLISSRRRICSNYIKSWEFKVDLLAALPMDVFYMAGEIGLAIQSDVLFHIIN